MRQGPWPCSCEDPWFSSKVHTSDMINRMLRYAYLLKVGFMQIPVYHEPIFIVCCGGIHTVFSSIKVSLGP